MKQADKGHDDSAGNAAAWVQALRVSTVGVEFGVGAVLGYLGGGWLDQRWGTAPYLTLVGLLLGVAAAFASLLRLVREVQRGERESAGDDDPLENDAGDDDDGDGERSGRGPR
ncbi:MAG: AtpZ/AtpI family protein [Proteobacteria bacterium]|nr:AtpZ/AtpI family protein [Pseudomonadota bacterium]